MSPPSITTWVCNDPTLLFSLAAPFAKCEGTALLYSGGELDSAESSFLFLFPYEKIAISASSSCWEELQKRLILEHPFPEWVGYLGYEMGAYADKDKVLPTFSRPLPDACFYRCAAVFKMEHRTRKVTLYAREDKLTQKERAWLAELPLEEGSIEKSRLSHAFSSDTLETYKIKIDKIKEWIRNGEIYQVNLSQEFHLTGETHPFSYFREICKLNPAPFSAFIQCGAFSIVSSSPERFLKKEGERLETRPIKGTAPRGKTREEDLYNQRHLLSSEKEKAELLMITDLMRNDIGKVSQPKSVVTKELWRCEAYTNVFHLLSIIEGKAQRGKHPLEIIRSLFPGGSITGCPKLRAIECIAEFEKRPRGIYTGSIGYFTGDGDFDFNIAIRTLVVHPHHIQIQLGGAIVIDSDPQKEYEETLHKGHTLFKVLEP